MDNLETIFTWKMISDPLYGYVYFNTEVEEPLINSVVLQRLRYIMQLQTAHFVYPGAVHTRFQHSVGVMHLSGLMAEDMVSKIVSLYGKEAIEGFNYATLVEASRLAGLLHDAGHAAFSHAFEHGVLWKKNLPVDVSNHERIGLILIKDLLWDQLEKAEKYLPDLKEVLFAILNVEEPKGVLRFFRWIVREGYYPSDVLDFLRRDSYYAGTVEYGSILYERLYKNTYPLLTESGISFVLDRIALGEFKQYMHAKTSMYEHVYYHSVCRSFDIILYEILDLLDREMDLTGRVLSILRGDPRGYLELTDNLLYGVMTHKALYEDTRLGYLCRRLIIERKPEWKRVGKEVSISAMKGAEYIEKTLKLMLDTDYRAKVVKEVGEYIAENLRTKGIDRNELWLDVLDISPIPKSTIYPGGGLSNKLTQLNIGKKIGRKLVVSEESNILLEELPIKVVFRVYIVRNKYSGDLESTITVTLVDAISSVLGIDVKAITKVIEKIYTSYSDKDYSKYRITA